MSAGFAITAVVDEETRASQTGIWMVTSLLKLVDQ